MEVNKKENEKERGKVMDTNKNSTGTTKCMYAISKEQLMAFQRLLWEARRSSELAGEALQDYTSAPPCGVEEIVAALGAIGMRLQKCISEEFGGKDYEMEATAIEMDNNTNEGGKSNG